MYYDADAMRTTLTLADDALALARRLARQKRVTLGEAVTELVRRGAQLPVPTTERHGLTVVRLPAGSARVTVAAVDALLDELP
jgi:hypothetical protein